MPEEEPAAGPGKGWGVHPDAHTIAETHGVAVAKLWRKWGVPVFLPNTDVGILTQMPGDLVASDSRFSVCSQEAKAAEEVCV